MIEQCLARRMGSLYRFVRMALREKQGTSFFDIFLFEIDITREENTFLPVRMREDKC